MKATDWIEWLRMEKHVEGGYFSRSYASDETVRTERHEGERPLYTSIYFLLESEDVSHFHRLKSDELWYFHAGTSLTVHIIQPDGIYRQEKLGLDMANGEKPQVLVEKGAIFGASVDGNGDFSLVGCMVSPGFDFADFELFEREELLSRHEAHAEIIQRLTRE